MTHNIVNKILSRSDVRSSNRVLSWIPT